MTDYRQLVVRLEKCFEAFMAALADFTELCDHAAADRARLDQIRAWAETPFADTMNVGPSEYQTAVVAVRKAKSQVRAILGDPHD